MPISNLQPISLLDPDADKYSFSWWQTVQIQISWLLQKPADLDLHCLQRQGISGFSRTRVNDSVDWAVKLQLKLRQMTKCYFFLPGLIAQLVASDYRSRKLCDFKSYVAELGFELATARFKFWLGHNFCGDWSLNHFFGHSPLLLIQEGQLSVTDEGICTVTGYIWLTEKVWVD